MSKIRSSPHPLHYALLWDNEAKVGIFDSPAPIWDGNTEVDMDGYMARYENDWLDKVDRMPQLSVSGKLPVICLLYAPVALIS